MTVLITLTLAGSDVGPFDLYSDADAYATPFETNVSRASLVAGYTSALVTDGSTEILARSTGVCSRDLFMPIEGAPTTTTTTTTGTPTTTTTTTTTSPSELPTISDFGYTDVVGSECFGNPGSYETIRTYYADFVAAATVAGQVDMYFETNGQTVYFSIGSTGVTYDQTCGCINPCENITSATVV